MKGILSLALVCLFAIVPAAEAAKKKAAKKNNLYSRLGEWKGITKVVDDFVTNCATDDRIKGFFGATAADPKRLKKFKSLLVTQICEATGGNCRYKGKNMREAHAGMGIKDEHFTALVEDLAKALDSNGVKEADKNALLGALAPMKTDIVEAKM